MFTLEAEWDPHSNEYVQDDLKYQELGANTYND